MREVVIARRFNGPPESGNGGYVAGRVAAGIEGAAEVTLRAPPPLERALALTSRPGGAVALCDGDALIAEARPTRLDLEVPPPPDLERAQRAARHYSGFQEHVFPTCFVCGPEREATDGLCIFPGPVGEGRVAAPWTPHASLADSAGRVREEFCWAALDCPGVFAFGPLGQQVVLGRLAAEITGPVRAGEPHVVLGWTIGARGRKLHTGTALFDAGGTLLGRARGIWIAVEPR